jgi:hypothetical protein
MAFPELGSALSKTLPVVTFFAGLLADWIRQKITHRSDERRQLGRVVADLLELRWKIILLQELQKVPAQFVLKIPEEAREVVATEMLRIFQTLEFVKSVFADSSFQERYRKAVDEIAGFRPVVAFQLRGKEKYFDLRKIPNEYFSAGGASPNTMNSVTNFMDEKCLPAIDETIREIGAAHGFRTRLAVRRALRRRELLDDPLWAEIQALIDGPLAEVVKSIQLQSATQLKT